MSNCRLCLMMVLSMLVGSPLPSAFPGVQSGTTNQKHAPSQAHPLSNPEKFLSEVRKYDRTKALVIHATEGIAPQLLVVHVAQGWHSLTYQFRLQGAQGFWGVWATIVRPQDPDSARIKLVDAMGNEVGGSGWIGGSSIWVQKGR